MCIEIAITVVTFMCNAEKDNFLETGDMGQMVVH